MAIERDGIKYACSSCIKGHRVKKCQHTNRELIAISKRGRQISQCKHCRDLRTTHKTHVKCTCAIERVPNPMNGCLCEIVHHCNCVASHLRDTSPVPTPLPVVQSSSEHEDNGLEAVSPSSTTLLSPTASANLTNDDEGAHAYINLTTRRDVFEFLTSDIDQLLAS